MWSQENVNVNIKFTSNDDGCLVFRTENPDF